MNLEQQLKQPVLNRKPSFYVDSDNLASNVEFIIENKIDSITLIPNENGYNIETIDFLQEIPFVQELYMGTCDQLKSYDGLSFLSKLQTLGIRGNKKSAVELSHLTSLKELYFTSYPKITGLDKLINLEIIHVSSTGDFFEIKMFKNYTHLKELSIYTSIISDGLHFLKENKELEFLKFSHMRRAFSIEGIEHLKDSLKSLHFASSKKIDNIHLVSQLTNLESLGFIDSVQIESADLLKPLTKLQAFGTFGSSYFINGDLRSLKYLKETIPHFKVQDKKHYFYE